MASCIFVGYIDDNIEIRHCNNDKFLVSIHNRIITDQYKRLCRFAGDTYEFETERMLILIKYPSSVPYMIYGSNKYMVSSYHSCYLYKQYNDVLDITNDNVANDISAFIGDINNGVDGSMIALYEYLSDYIDFAHEAITSLHNYKKFIGVKSALH